MDGLLVVDKPVGPTSHDVVARLRRALREKRIGHTGTLDPMASGVLTLVIGRATRLAQFLAADEKAYDARITLGVNTDTYDADGTAVGETFEGPWPTRTAVDAALEAFRGSFLQQPPAYSAKKINGQRSYAIARRQASIAAPAEAPPVLPAAVPVTLTECRLTGCEGAVVDLSLVSSAGFYVRSLAHDLGARLGTGAHLTALRRVRSGAATLVQALPLAVIEADPSRAIEALVPMARMLPAYPAVVLTPAGLKRTRNGALLGPADLADPAAWAAALMSDGPAGVAPPEAVRLLGPDGDLVALGRPAGPGTTALHPSVVLM